MIDRLELEDVDMTMKYALTIYNDNITHYVNRTALLKKMFKPHLDNKEVGTAWFNVMKRGEVLQKHKDDEITKSFLFYIKSTGESPLVVEGKEYSMITGDFVTYPSYSEHGVPNVNEDERITLVIETSDKLLTSEDYERCA